MKAKLSAGIAILGISLSLVPATAQERNGQDMTCRGKLIEQKGSGGNNIKIGSCVFTIGQYTGVVITDGCRIGQRCTVRARVVMDDRGVWIDHAYSVRGSEGPIRLRARRTGRGGPK
jgi:UDP-3-O-[3-hydroxymyristoyl] glucosamine N-acyltransferase